METKDWDKGKGPSIRHQKDFGRSQTSESVRNLSDVGVSKACALALTALQERVFGLETENRRLRESVEAAERRRKKCELDFNSLKTLENEGRAALERCQNENREKDQLIEQLKTDCERWEAWVERMKAEAKVETERNERAIENSRKEKRALLFQLETAKKHTFSLPDELKSTRKERSPASWTSNSLSPINKEMTLPRVMSFPSDFSSMKEAKERFQLLQKSVKDAESALEKKEKSLQFRLVEMAKAFHRSENERMALLQYQLKAKSVLEDVTRVNERLVAALQQKTRKSTSDSIDKGRKTVNTEPVIPNTERKDDLGIVRKSEEIEHKPALHKNMHTPSFPSFSNPSFPTRETV